MSSASRAPGTPDRPSPEGLPSGRYLEDGSSRVEDLDAASMLHGRGGYGHVGTGGALSLDPLETSYLCEQQRLRVSRDGRPPLQFKELLSRAHGRDPSFEIRYLVYRDLRQRGYVVLAGPEPADFSVLPRGGTPEKTPSRWWVEARSERTPFQLSEVSEHLSRVRGARRTLLLGIVDEESDLTYYRVREVEPQGSLAPPMPAPSGAAILLEDRVSVFEPSVATALDQGEHFGSRVGERLELSLLEALYLGKEGRLALCRSSDGKEMEVQEFEERALRTEPDLPSRLPVYRHLRRSGLIPKTGFKYGAHFRAYEGDPESTHARYLVHVVPADWKAPWPEVARAIRLAQGVRKQFLLASLPTTGDDATVPHYLHLERIRP